MVSVVQRIKNIKQPRGGYINPNEFKVIQLNDRIELRPVENVHSSTVGSAVDYLSRLQSGASAEDAFKICIVGAQNINQYAEAMKLIEKIKGLDDESIKNACKAVGYDVCFRAGPAFYKPVEEINADEDTVNNIRVMVNRSLKFFEEYGPVISDGFTFEGGYTETVSAGDGDFMTESTLWDFKVSVNKPTKEHTLQLLVYYLMGLRSKHADQFKNLSSLGIFNPRLNKVYLLDIENIPKDVMREVSEAVIGY